MNPKILKKNDVLLLVIDIQEKLFEAIDEKFKGKIISSGNFLINAAKEMEIPIVVTEQYPKGLGKTIDDIDLPADVVEKISFSCFKDENFIEKLQLSGKKQLIIFGIETHVCVTQTALDALQRNYDVFVASDACGSRNVEEHEIALQRMAKSGCVIGSAEMFVYELLEKAGTDSFKKILKYVKEKGG